MFPSLPHHLPDNTLYISMPSLLFFIVLSFATEDYAGKSFVVRERAPSGFVFRLFRSKDRSSLPFVSTGDRARDIVCVSTKLDGFNLERVSPHLPAAILETASGIVCVYKYTYIRKPSCIGQTTQGSKDPFPFGRQTALQECSRRSKVDLLLSFDIYCSYMYSEIRPYPNVTCDIACHMFRLIIR